jgi:hypothetical protein
LALALALALWAGRVWAEGPVLVGPVLGASTDFGQTSRPSVLAASQTLPLTVFRDEIFWDGVEADSGAMVYDNPRTTYPDLLTPLGAELLFLVNNPHRNHDGGTTPQTPAGVAAFARYTAQTLQRFAQIKVVEVGNEMNSGTFAWGPGWAGEVEERAASYVRLLAATATAARAARPGIEVLGGAAHSVPIAWFREIFARGAAEHMDALVIHPYTVVPEQLARQIALLRQEVPQTADMPIAVTEFGQTNAATAPAYLLKSYCQMANSGVNRAVWYPLNPRGDGLAALLTPEGELTAVGETFRFVRAHLEGLPVEDIAPDPFTYGCRFGGAWMVLWGEPRGVVIDPAVQAFDLFGRQVGLPPTLSPDVPLILYDPDGHVALGREVTLAASEVIADSWHQFAYPGGEDPFQRLARQGGRVWPLILRPGQERDGVPWTPYLGGGADSIARAAAEWVLPAMTEDGPIDIVYRYVAARDESVRVEVRLMPWEGGVTLSVAVNGREVSMAGAASLALRAGDVLDVVAGANGSGGGADLRVILHQDAR